MHGVRRGSRPSPDAIREEYERSAVLADLIRRALLVRSTPLQWPLEEDFEAKYRLVERALETNPDEYTLWAFRREVLLLKLEHSEAADPLWKFEVDLTTRALRRHPKAYPAWQHRLWLFENATISSAISKLLRAKAIEEERLLSSIMLSKDSRNFHGWAHRMRVRAVIESNTSGESTELAEKELSFVEGKINDDFANYSAWHHRSVLLPQIHQDGPSTFLRTELEYVRQAFYTEPDVQSAWFYHRWLLAGAPARGKQATVLDTVLQKELVACDELLSIEPEARYCLQTKAHILFQLGRGVEAGETLDTLKEIDPMRKGYYEYLRTKERTTAPKKSTGI